MEAPTLLTQTLHAQALALRQQADILDALAMAHAGGADSDMLKASEVQELLRCGRTKACEIIKKHGSGAGRMGRIEKGTLMQLQRAGQI